jgi:predicted TIM-barrel fold metal-dependent hydrolase
MADKPRIRRIATEEAFSIPEVAAELRKVAQSPGTNLDLELVNMIYNSEDGGGFLDPLLDLEEKRLRIMDENGVDMHLLSLTAPGVQMFDADTATGLATLANDRLAEVIQRHPDRFAGLASFAPQSPKRAAAEMERAINKLKLNGFIVNSHTNNEYLDHPKYWPILEAAEALDAPIYIHPTPPPAPMIEPYLARGLEGPLAGFSAEVYLHTLAIITSGALDRFPNLKIVIGHLGEGLPYLMYRLDYMQHHAARPGLRGKKESTRLKKKISDYLRENIYITTSGMAWAPAIRFAQEVLGVERVLYAMDYPYQFDKAEVDATDALEISDADKKKLYQTNAEELFCLNE